MSDSRAPIAARSARCEFEYGILAGAFGLLVVSLLTVLSHSLERQFEVAASQTHAIAP